MLTLAPGLKWNESPVSEIKLRLMQEYKVYKTLVDRGNLTVQE